MPTIEFGSRWRRTSMHARATGDSPLAPKRPLSWMKTPAAEAMTKPANMPTRNVPAEPEMSRLSPTIGSLRALVALSARSERAGREKQESAKFWCPEVETLFLSAGAKGRRVRQQRRPLEARWPGVRGRGGRLSLGHRLKTIADVVQPEHGCADVGPVRARREIIEDLAQCRRQLAETSQRQVIVGRSERAPQRSGFGTDAKWWIGRGSAVVGPELLLQQRTVARIADRGSGGERQPQSHNRVRIPSRRGAVKHLGPRNHAREIGVEVVVRPECSDIGSARDRLVPAGGGKQHSAAN